MRSKEQAYGLPDVGPSDPTFWEVFNHHTDPLEADEGIGLRSWGPQRVYFIHAPKISAVKVGFSANPQKRKAEIAKAGIGPLVLLGVLNGGRDLERLMHERFAEYRMFGEWFSEEIIEEAETLIRADREFYGPEQRAAA